MMDKRFDSNYIEKKWYKRWLESGAFASNNQSPKEPYVIMMPPPNVTGSLHIGHALTFTIQDILIRFHRMQGLDVLWQPGTDHAGIATQMVVERELAKSNLTRHGLGREKFVEKVWEWKEKSGGEITNQLRALGASPDWEKERFTMDEGLSKAVNSVFVKLYKKGLIYRDKRLVNWDPKLLTAISDLEVEQKEVEGKFWYFKYPIENSEEFLTIATTRPETMLGDTAVAVNPDDDRYTNLKGKYLIGNMVVSLLLGASFLFVGVSHEMTSPMLIPMLLAFGLTFLREIIKDVADIEGDLSLGLKTYPIISGVDSYRRIIISLCLLVGLFSLVPYLIGIYGTGYLLLLIIGVEIPLSIIMFVFFKNPSISSAIFCARLLKFSTLMGLLSIYFGTV